MLGARSVQSFCMLISVGIAFGTLYQEPSRSHQESAARIQNPPRITSNRPAASGHHPEASSTCHQSGFERDSAQGKKPRNTNKVPLRAHAVQQHPIGPTVGPEPRFPQKPQFGVTASLIRWLFDPGGGRPLGSGRQLPPQTNCWPEAP